MAQELLARVLDAHGGRANWDRVNEIRYAVRCGGLALAARWQKNAFRQYRAQVSTRAPRVRFDPFKGQRGVFTADKVWIDIDPIVLH